MNCQAAPLAGLPVDSEEICGQKSSLSSCNSSMVIPILPDLGPVDRAERPINLHLLSKSWFVMLANVSPR